MPVRLLLLATRLLGVVVLFGASARAATPVEHAPPYVVPREAPYRRPVEEHHHHPPRRLPHREEHRARAVPLPVAPIPLPVARGQPAAPLPEPKPRAPVVATPAAPAATPPAPVAPPPAQPATAEPTEPAAKVPRFAALKTDDTNMRKGPGQRYPIEWVYKRHDLPMEVERQYDVWRYVRDPDGIEGWVHQVTLSDRRTFIVQNKDATLRSDAKDTASPVAILKVGVIGRLHECDAGSNWCQVQVDGYKGYLRRDQFWGLLPDEVLNPS